VVSIDTLRADRLGCYGYHKPTSPTIDRLAAGGIRFERAVAESSWTLPSHMTLMTGLYPSAHDVVQPKRKLSRKIPTLAQTLAGNGYRTYANTGGGYVGRQFGFHRGFEKYVTERQPFTDVVSQFLDWLDGLQPKEQFLAFLHTYEVHCPYDPPPNYRELLDVQAPDVPLEIEGKCPEAYFNKLDLTDDQVRYLSDLYDADIRRIDDAVAELLAGLDERALRRNTIMVLLSDHGEEFREHGSIGHGRNLFYPVLNIPMIVSGPALAPGTIEVEAGLVDVVPTLLDVLGVDGMNSQGRSFAGALGGMPIDDQPGGALSEHDRKEKLVSIVAGPHHLILDVDSGDELLFDVDVDPAEQHNLIERDSETTERMRSRLAEARAGLQAEAGAQEAEQDAAKREQLRALGYVED
jgi:arylsulfatase A-like enzyme